jgi:hypothetical protein
MISAIINRGKLNFVIFEATHQECQLHRTHEAVSRTVHAQDLLDGRRPSEPHRSAAVKMFAAD